MIQCNDFRYMRQGRQLRDLKSNEQSLLASYQKENDKKGQALLLLHGFSSSPAVYRTLIPQITHYDAIVCPALPGHAESIECFSQVTAKQWLDEVHQHYLALHNNYEKVDVIGLSLGGLLACELAKTCSINHLYLLAPALKLRMKVPLILAIARLACFLGFVHFRSAAGNILNTEETEISYRKLPVNTIIEMLKLVQSYQWQVPNCPVDLFLGAQDGVVNSQAVEELFLPLNNVRIHWLLNSAHVLPLDNDLNQIVTCINQTSALG